MGLRLFSLWSCCCGTTGDVILDEAGHAILDEAGSELDSE